MNETHYMNPMNIATFEQMFFWDSTRPLLIAFLNVLLAGRHHIIETRNLSWDYYVDENDDYGYIQELLCQTEERKQVVVQLLNSKNDLFMHRSVYYTVRAAERQLRKPGKRKYAVEEFYTFVFLDFTDERLGDKPWVETSLCNVISGMPLNDYLHIIYVQAPRFTKTVEECVTSFDRWMYVFRHMEVLDELPESFSQENFEMLKQKTDLRNMTDEQRKNFQKNVERYDVKTKYDWPGRKEMRENLNQMRERLIQKAYDMKDMGYSVNEIMYYTGLSEKEVYSL
jgi:predicted transposase/invertase (TIGR01784 family)